MGGRRGLFERIARRQSIGVEQFARGTRIWSASAIAAEMDDDFRAMPLENPARQSDGEPLDLQDIRNSLKAITWRAAGVRRNQALLEEAADSIDHWRKYVLVRQFDSQEGWELQNMLTVARVMVAAALARQESRGTHLRTDHRQTDDLRWRRHLRFRRGEADDELVPY